ncbi:MAG: CotH kinase family protein [Melioribacteraceae bacterium]|nr:CotH kinase family protein [Melioribacteraceae bacterium]
MPKRILLLFSIISTIIYSQTISINEVQSSNSSTLADDYGEFSDWIEVYNSSQNEINLDGYYLSDNENNLLKWKFPDKILKPDTYLLLFASGRDINSVIMNWDTKIDKGDSWKYFIGTTNPSASWNNITYNDVNWNTGTSGIGYGDNDDETVIANTISLFMRKSFEISDVNNISKIIFNIDYDDGFVAYINGVEVARENLGVAGQTMNYNDFADMPREAEIYQGGKPVAFDISDIKDVLVEGENILAVQVHNTGTNSSDLTAIPFLTVGYNSSVGHSVRNSEYISLEQSYLHTSFKLSALSENLYLSDSAGILIEEVDLSKIGTDKSYGRFPNGDGNWVYFESPTPGVENLNNGFNGIAEEAIFSTQGGFHSGIINLELSSTDSNSVIKYTLDGSEPDKNSSSYNTAIIIDENKIIRAKAFADGMLPSNIKTETYLFGNVPNLDVISISSDPDNFWDNDSGIYVMGPNAETANPHFGANFWQDWEKPINIEYFNSEGEKEFSSNAGIKIFGAWSRAKMQKSLAIHFRSKYGKKELEHNLFDNRDYKKYKSFVLRNSGNDWEFTSFRDGLMQNIIGDTGLETLEFHPVVVFLNGEYWGKYNLREKISEHYIANKFGLDPATITIVEPNQGVNGYVGDDHYDSMLRFIEENDLSEDENFQHVSTLVDVDDFMKYNVAQIFFGNTDWPGNNMKLWRANDNKSKWRWIVYDTDFGFALYDDNADLYMHNTLQFALEQYGPGWPNPPWSTFLLRNLVKNEKFKNKFINTFADFSNSIFKTDFIDSKIDSFKTLIDSEMRTHFTKWPQSGNYEYWKHEVERLKSFSSKRLNLCRIHFVQEFNLSTTRFIKLDISDDSEGSIQLNSLYINTFPWNGFYFYNVPVTIKAIPKPGYRFESWEGSTESADSILVSMEYNLTLKANFVKEEQTSVAINEISYTQSDDFDSGDWIELYNYSRSDADISNWMFKDSDDNHNFIIKNKTIKSNDYFVLCADTAKFKNIFPNVTNYLGDFDFGLSSNGELVRVYSASGGIVDSLTFKNELPWPIISDGENKSLELIDVYSENSDPGNWDLSIRNGTPGYRNDVATEIDENSVGEISEYILYQNYPNPFNPATTIEFSIPNVATGHLAIVQLNVFDILGRKIKTLVNKKLSSGNYKIKFDAEVLPSGIYFYRIEAGRFTDTRKMILLK